MNFDELNIFVKFCYNRINGEVFLELMSPIYNNDERYINKLFSKFRDDPTGFIVTRSEKELFNSIQNKIIQTNYKG